MVRFVNVYHPVHFEHSEKSILAFIFLGIDFSLSFEMTIFVNYMELTEQLQERIDLIRHKLKFIELKPMVACVTTLDPIRLGNDDVAGLIALAGGTSISGDAEIMRELNPDVIILKPEGYTMDQAMANVNQLLQLPGFTDLKAIKSNRFYIVDGDRFVENTEENFVDSVELLAEIIYPKQFIFGHEGQGWIKFSL
jgi:iron complex transport system substrate-binding protein